MIVGYMRGFKNPNHMARLLAMICEYHGMSLLYFNPGGVSIENNKIRGKMLFNNVWIEVEVNTPKFIDINPNYFNRKKYKHVINHLQDTSTLSADRRMPLPKDKLQEVFKEDSSVSKYLIPTKNITSYDDILESLKKYKTVVLKPVFSNQGKNVFILRKEEESFRLGYNKEEYNLSAKEVMDFYTEKVKDKRFIIQKYIESRTPQGHPFDCRVHVEKNSKNKWRNVKNFIRIGVGQTVISNVSQGGGITNVKDFLLTTYPDKWEAIYEEIKETAKIIPYKVEKILGKDYMTMGIDIGIDSDGSLYMYEVNDYPIVSPMRSEVAMTRVEYYKYKLMKADTDKRNE